MLCTSVSNDVPQPCKHAWKHTMIPCIVPHRGRGYNGFGEKIRFWGRGRKGNVKRVTRRNLLPLKPARSLKGNVKGGKRQNSLPFRRGAEEKGSVKRETRRNSLLFRRGAGLKGNVKGGSR